MTETPAPYFFEPAQNQDDQPPCNGGFEFPDTPEITEKTLECIVIPKPAGGNTLTRYIMTDGERYAKFEELTAEERETVLKFILKYAAPLVINRLPRRIKATPDDLTSLDLDPEPLNRILEETEAERSRKQAEEENTQKPTTGDQKTIDG